MRVEAEAEDQDGDPVVLQYDWKVNDVITDEKGDSISGLERGDRVQVVITPSDGKQSGPPQALVIQIQNQSPKITPTQPEFNDPNWKLQISANDPDGDQLTYSLKDGPVGMTVDGSGLVSWNVSNVDDGTYSATVEVSDGQGGTTQVPFNVVVGHQKPPEEQ